VRSALLDQDERAGQPVRRVAVEQRSLGGLDADDADVVDAERGRRGSGSNVVKLMRLSICVTMAWTVCVRA